MFTQQNTGNLFGSPSTGGSLFGSGQQQTASATGTSMFGAQQPSTSGSLFGAKPAGSLFGATTTQTQPSGGLFGQAQQQQQQPSTGFTTGGGLFGAKPATSAFGQVSQPSLFGQTQPQQSTGGLFSNAAAPTFGTATTTTSSLFGSGTTPSLGFGQQQPQAQTGGIFGAKPAHPTFGTFATGQTGTNVVKFAPATGTDSMQLKGQQTQVSTKQICISAMKEYENKSLEELRVADYLAGRKVNASGVPNAGGGSMFGQQQQQPSSGLFGSAMTKPGLFSNAATTTTTPSMFGTQQPSTSGGLFGAKPAGSLFGATTTQPAGGGLFGQAQPQQQQQSTGFTTGGGLFGAKPATSAFGQVSQPSLFGQAQPQQAGGLFSSAAPSFGATTTTTSSLFGSGTTPSLGFGQQQPQAQTGGLFGAKPAQPTFGAFGATTQQQPFGTAPSTGSSLFGPAAPKIGGGLFGAQPQQTGGGLFGSAGSNMMPKQGMFGAQPQQGTGLFGAGTAQPTFGSPASMPMAGSPPIYLGSNVNISGIQQAIIDAQLSTLPYGDTPFLKSPVSPRRSPQDISSLQRQLNMGISSSKRVQEHLASMPPTSVNGVLSTTTAGGGSPQLTEAQSRELTAKSNSLNGSLLDGSFSYKPMVLLPSVGFGTALGLHQSPKLITTRSSDKSLLFSEKSFSRTLPAEEGNIKALDMSVVFEPREEFQIAPDTPSQQRAMAEVSPMRNESQKQQAKTTPEIPPKPRFEETPVSQLNKSSPRSVPSQKANQSPPEPTAVVQQPQKKYRIKLTRPEYYTEPSLDQLEEMFNADGICRLESGLTVGRLGYGSVFWKGPLELREPVDLDEIVHFRNKEVVVYPDEAKKPPIGSGLNKQAEVSLERVWPIEPATKQMIKDPEELRRIGFREKLERLSQRMDATFRDYQPTSGTWQFEVQHFSKYGFLEEEDDDSASMDTSASEELKRQAHMQALVQKAKVPLREIQKSLEGNVQQPAAMKTQQQKQQNGNGNQQQQPMTMMAGNSKRFLEHNLEESLGADDDESLLKYNNDMMDFNEDSKHFQEEIIRKKFKFDDTLFESSKLLSMMAEKDGQPLTKRRPTLVERMPKNMFKEIPLLMSKSTSMVARTGIPSEFPSCRPGFSKGLILISLPPKGHTNVVNIYQAEVIPTIKHYFMHFIQSQAAADRQRTLQNLEASELVSFEPSSPLLCFLDGYVTASHGQNKEHLKQAIGDICSILLMKADTIEEKIAQRTRMGHWLRARLAEEKPRKQSLFAIVFHHLVTGRIQKAIETARQARHYNLTLLLTLYKSPSSPTVREQVTKQLSSMNRRQTDGDYVRIVELLSGEWSKAKEGSGCLRGLSWLQVLGVLIWYHVAPSTTLVECVDTLEELMTK